MRTCEDGCNGCDECTDYGDDQGHRPPRFLRDEHDIAAFFAEQADPALKPDIAALKKRMDAEPEFAAQVTGEREAPFGNVIRPLHERLQACIDDPMWADHAEVPKTLLRQTLEELALVRAAMGVAYGYLWLVNNEPGTPNRYPPEKAAADARQLQHCAIAVSDWLAGGCDANDIPRPHIAALVAWAKETTREAAALGPNAKVTG